jgi:beta-glucosidase
MGVPDLSAFTVAHKAALCLGSDFWHTAPVPEQGVEAILVSDGPHGLRRQPDGGDHVGIGGSLPATCFPPAGRSVRRGPELARGRRGDRAGGAAQGSPSCRAGCNIKRPAVRTHSRRLEDPYQAGRSPARGGLQSQVSGRGRHFAVNQETDRVRVSADVDERTLREIYLPAFEHVVTAARPWT